ncbi:hypothetical protein [Streptomyces griseosporeus]|uniref:hypothetical protein n=1 Tax=Streptomyces griseosporeus TaxID=1910 RepID=UPI00167CB6DA|nr:hypothetical protein [Streptomyces griseosporeus]GHF92237.1 hypothetical protein GCM10018783_73870 [Streptomyces griseosporeus]
MSDENEIEFEGGFFEEADVKVNDIPDDPFGFGNDFWPIYVVEVGPAKLTANKDKVGMMVKFAIDHPRFEGSAFAEKLGNGHWYRLPVPLALRSQVPWDPNGDQEKRTLFQLKQLYSALGFKADEMPKVNGAMLVGRKMMAKIKPVQDDMGFYQFRLNSMKPYVPDSGDGASEFTKSGTSNPSPQDLLKAELED